MRTRFVKTVIVIVMVIVAVVQLLPLAAGAVSFPFWPSNATPLLSCGISGRTPCTSLCQLIETSQNFIYFGLTFLLFAIAPVLIAWGGIQILIAGPSPSRLESGKKILTGTIIAVVIGLGAFLIVNTFLFFIGARINPEGKGGVAFPNIDCSAPPQSGVPPTGAP